MPLVSVIIPTYQNGQYVSQAIESVLKQTCNDFEIIVVDDGSSDNTPTVLQTFKEKIIIVSQSNRGTPAARNAGIKICQGKYIAFLDADDIWLEDKLEKQLALFEKNPRVGLVYSDIYFFEGKTRKGRAFEHIIPKSGHVEIDLFQIDFVPMPTVVIKHECLDTTGLFDETLRYCEDYDLWLRISHYWEFDFVNKPLALYRLSPEQKSRNYASMLADMIELKKKALVNNIALQTLPGPVLENSFYFLYLNLARLAIGQNRYLDARKLLLDYRTLRGFTTRYAIINLYGYLPNWFIKFVLFFWDHLRFRK